MIYRFEDFEFNTELYTLSRAGQTKRLRPKVFQVLCYLIEHGDRVVSKQELAEQVWPDQFIANSTLESTIRLLRQELGDSGRAQRIIQTSHGYGYRFAVAVISPEANPPSNNHSQDETWRCSVCQHVNTADPHAEQPYCVACGAPSELHCPQCGTDNLPQANFCVFCGTGLTGLPAPPASRQTTDAPKAVPQDQHVSSSSVPTGRHVGRAERRQLTVMVCDLVDATGLSERLDLEDLHDVLQVYQTTCSDVARRFGGHVAQNTSTGLWFYFGYPQANEDDARRAAHTALGIIAALRILNVRLAREKGIKLRVQLGIHTGPVVIDEPRDGQRSVPLPLGITPNIASQIQAVAKPDTVVVSAATAHLIEGYFTCHELACQPLEREPEPIRLMQILEATGAVSRLDVVPMGRLTQFVGREAEISLLLDRWNQAKEGEGQVVLLSGEAGIGKSRLVYVMRERIADDSHILLECRCSPYHQQSVFYPVIDLFRRVLQWQDDDMPDEKFIRLEGILAQYELSPKEIVPFFAFLLGLRVPDDRYPSLSLSPEQHRQKTLEAILAFLLAMASRQPVLLIIEDLQWIDPSTLELLTLLMDQIPVTSICLLFTCRPTFQVPWTNRSYLTQITLSRLSRRLVEQMVRGITESKTLPSEVLRRVLELTDGIPLFVEELIKTILETAPLQEIDGRYELMTPLSILAIPTTLHDSLMARLDRLEAAKGVAQLGATIGRQFTYALLRAVWEQDEAMLQHGLARLVEAELIYQQGLYSRATYVFKHALIQETAYQSLLRRTRQHYHERIAHVLVEQFPERIELQPELLAHHYTEGGLVETAVPYWHQAGLRALKRSANHEAVRHFTKALELFKTLPATLQHVEQELTLLLALGPPLRMIKGHTSSEVECVYTRAYELSQQVGDSRQEFSVLVSLWRFYLSQVKLRTALELAEQCFASAQRLQDPELLQDAHRMLGLTSFYQGEPLSARMHLEQGMVLYDTQQSRLPAHISGMDPGVSCLSYLAWTLWLLGYPDQARSRSNEALALAQQLSHAYSLNFALAMALIISASCRDMQSVHEQAEATIDLAREQGFVRWLAVGTAWKGWALAEQGEAEEGIRQIRQAVDMWRVMGGELGLPQIIVIKLAEAYGKGGQPEEGLCKLAEALDEVSRSDERRFEAEIYRCQGELLLQSGAWCPQSEIRSPKSEEAENCFRQSIDVASSQHAMSLELRAVMSLSRLWQQQGKRQEAFAMLEATFSQFTEGFDTLDLQEAKALLKALQ